MTRIRISTLDRNLPLHLSGISGSAMSGLALMLRQMGFQVVGTDPKCAEGSERLTAAGIAVYPEQDGRWIPEEAGLVIASAALPPEHPELVRARDLGVPVITYPAFLGALMAERDGVAIAGTHGKTTVTAMVTWCLRAADLEPGFVIGGYVPCIGAGAAAGTSDIFVAEACEYNRSFLNLHPRVAVITNIEADHLDVYGSFDAVKAAFREFASHLPAEDGVLIYSAACPSTPEILNGLDCRTVSFGVDMDADYSASPRDASASMSELDLVIHGAPRGRLRLSLPGRHNVANALAAIAVCDALGVPPEKSLRALAQFTGVRRRFELRGEVSGVTVVDDYAHHPTELRALIDGARERFPGRRLRLAFQPHQYSRTRLLMDDFAAALAGADEVLVPNIFFARDSDTDAATVRPTELVEKINRWGTPASHLGSLDALTAHLAKHLAPGDVLITAGAGDIDAIVEPLLSGLERRTGTFER